MNSDIGMSLNDYSKMIQRAEAAEARAAQAEQQRDTLERRVEQMQSVIDALNADNDALEEQLRQAQQICGLAYRAIVLSNSRSVDWNDIADQLHAFIGDKK